MKLSVLGLLASAACVAATPVAPAAPRPAPHLRPMRPRQSTNSTSPPCARVSDVIYSEPHDSLSTQIPAKLAYDCLQSIPVNVSSAKNLLADMPTYVNWQSTLTALKNPPAEYVKKVQPPVDILGGFKEISAQLDAGKFTSEYDFGWALYTLIQSAHDGHFTYIPDSVSTFFTWGRPVPLVSVSEDGEKLPAIFAFVDVLGLQFKNISYTPSPVTQIDGIPAKQFLEKWSQSGSLQDRDALYNNAFYQLSQVSLGTDGTGTGSFTGGGRGRFVYPGATTTLTFANGTNYTMENYANVWQTFRGIQTGEDLANKFFTYGASSASAKTIAAAASNDNPQIPETPGYPAPIVAGPADIINGYYINASGHEDVAVLQVANFVNVDYYEEPFQQASQKFLAKAVADGKTKLIIDVQANGGGTILQGYDLFKQLFPSIDPYGANRWRYTEAADLIGQAYSAYTANAPRGGSGNYTLTSLQVTWFDRQTDMTVDGKPFSSWEEKVGPVEVNGDNYTVLARWNLSDPLIEYFGGINITGYGPLANITGPPKFKPENIVLLTDGYCASTCSIFSEFLTKQAGVKTIAMGGRSNRNKIQAIGGVKGVNSLSWSYIQNAAENARDYAPPGLKEKLQQSVLATDYPKNLVFNRAASGPSLNVRDGLAPNDTSGIALQFIYEEADCRLYYSPEMTVDATAIWKAAADAQWGNSGKCVGGGYGSGEEKRSKDVSIATTKLTSGRVKMGHAAALQQYEAFERSFKLETISNKERAGWMQP